MMMVSSDFLFSNKFLTAQSLPDLIMLKENQDISILMSPSHIDQDLFKSVTALELSRTGCVSQMDKKNHLPSEKMITHKI